MQILTKDDYKTLTSLAGLSQKSMRKVLKEYLHKKYDKVLASEDYVIALGDIPIALVAHMDTVFSTPPTNFYYDKEKGVIWSPEGLGADDRAGIFAILKILQDDLKPTIIFTTDEELGCVGAEKLVSAFPEPPTDLKYIIQLDRRGKCDCVFYGCENPKFTAYVSSFGFIENFGSFSDISIICPAWGIAGVNLSVGYEDEHSYVETLHVAPLLATISKVKYMLKETIIPSFEYIEGKSYWLRGDITCAKCGMAFSEYDSIPVKCDGVTKYYCPDCCIESVEWCEVCGECFEKKDKKDCMCPDCAEVKKICNKSKTHSKK